MVIKKLLQMKPREHKDLIVQVSRMVDSLTVPMARASVLWMIGEYCNLVPKIAPDILRKAAKNFTNEVCGEGGVCCVCVCVRVCAPLYTQCLLGVGC